MFNFPSLGVSNPRLTDHTWYELEGVRGCIGYQEYWEFLLLMYNPRGAVVTHALPAIWHCIWGVAPSHGGLDRDPRPTVRVSTHSKAGINPRYKSVNIYGFSEPGFLLVFISPQILGSCIFFRNLSFYV